MNVKSDTREKILKTASSLFQKQGYNATGLNQIIKESGAPKGSLYYHFPNGKEELALESIKLVNGFIKKNLVLGLSQIEDPSLGIQLLLKEIAKGILGDKQFYLSVSLLSLETCETNETLRKACEEAIDSWIGIFSDKLIDSGFGEDRANKYAITIQLMIEGAITMSLVKKDTTPLLIVADQIPYLLKNT